MTELALEWKVDGVEAWSVDDVFIVWQRGVYSMAAAEANHRSANRLAKRSAGFRLALIVEPEVPPPDEHVRQHLMSTDNTRRIAFAIVTESSGFRAVLVNGIATAVALATSLRSPVKAFNNTSSAAEWLGSFATPNDADRVRRAFDSMRAGSVG